LHGKAPFARRTIAAHTEDNSIAGRMQPWRCLILCAQKGKARIARALPLGNFVFKSSKAVDNWRGAAELR
jgi:hypothetical protein